MDLFQKIGITTFTAYTCLQITIAGLIHMENTTSSFVETGSEEAIITMESRSLSSQPDILIAPFTQKDIFLSEEKKANFTFTTVGLSWEEISPEGTNVEGFIRFKNSGEWSEWLDLEEEEDQLIAGRKYATASTNAANAFQYKFEMYSDGQTTPIIKATEYTFIKSGSKISYQAPEEAQYFASTAVSSAVTVIRRSSWGADESKRYLKPGEERVLAPRDEDFYQKYRDELQYSRVVSSDNRGELIWPLQYPEEVKKVVIHHTATTKDLDNPQQAIRDIYHYHAVSRGWGDIGYNYIIDRDGNIYEGRFGGEGVIGAHAGPGNHGSIGVAMLGNYQSEPVPEKAIQRLSQFLYQKGKIHNIELDGHSTFRGKNMPNIFGHRDVMNTTCPGQYLYDKIPLIRTLAATAFTQKEKFVKDYDFQDLSQLYYTELLPRETKKITLKVENIGKVEWNDQTFLKLGVNPDFAYTLEFPTKQGLILAGMKESRVKPGETATFEVDLKAGETGKTVNLEMEPVINGNKSVGDKLRTAVTIQPPIYKYEVVDKSFPPKTMKTGESFDGFIKVKNTGNVVWDNINLADGSEEVSVKPGATATLNFTYKAPKTSGTYTKLLTLNIPSAKYTPDVPLSFTTLAYKGDYDSQLITKTLNTSFQQGENYTLAMNLTNTGLKTWNKTDLNGSFLTQPGIKISDISMSPETVKTGESAHITFTVTIDKTAPLKDGNFIAKLSMADHKISKPVVFKYKVSEQKFQDLDPSSEENIRVKLSFNGEPEISGNGTFEVYSGEEFVRSVNVGDKVKVSRVDGKYKVLIGSTSFLKEGPIRIIPKSSAILEISNYENRPAWNPTLNDNQFRGILEIREDDGKLIVINELPLEDYLKGLGEVSNSELPEKIKAIMVAARSYAKFYMEIDEKFPGKPYHLDDNPDVSQKYLGYGLEKRSPNVSAGVSATKGKVIGHNGVVVKAPYFNQSDGKRTKSANEVWGWTHTPYLVSVDDSICDADGGFLGHGVGMSGCGAKGLALQGKNFEQILKHYYTGVEILDLY